MLGFFETGFSNLGGWPSPILMIFIGFLLLYLGIAKKMEPLLLVPIGFGLVFAVLIILALAIWLTGLVLSKIGTGKAEASDKKKGD